MTKDFITKNDTHFKAMGDLAQGYTVIPNNIMNDMKNIGVDAFAVLTKVCQYIHSKEHTVTVRGLNSQIGISKDRVSRALHKLMDLGYMNRVPKKRGNLTIGYTYEVYLSPIENTNVHRNPEIQDTEFQDTVVRDGKKENNKNKNNKKENIVVVASEKETQLLEMYKSFKLEKRVMPHTLKLLKANCDKFDLEVFEQIFINASSDDVKKKYNYIKDTLDKLTSKGIFTIGQYNNDQEQRKAVRDTKKTYRQSNNSNTGDPTFKTKFHYNAGKESFRNYTPDELEKLLKESQEGKF